MKKLMIFVLLSVSMILLNVPVFSKESSIILYQSDSLLITETKATYRGKVIYDAIAEPKKYGEDAPFWCINIPPCHWSGHILVTNVILLITVRGDVSIRQPLLGQRLLI